MVDLICPEIDVGLLEGALGIAPIELIDHANLEARGRGGMFCAFDAGEEPGLLTIELWPLITDQEMVTLLQSLHLAGEGGIEVLEEDGRWLVEMGANELALVKKHGNRWWSIGLTLPAEDELPDSLSLDRALVLVADQFS